jgi:hypothetical protein
VGEVRPAGGPYAPYLLNRNTTPAERAGERGATLYWLVSTWNPYEGTVMKTLVLTQAPRAPEARRVVRWSRPRYCTVALAPPLAATFLRREELSSRVLRVCLIGLAVGLVGEAASGERPATHPAAPVATNAHVGINEWEMHSFLRHADAVADSGVGSIRVALPWQGVEPQPDVYAWDLLDRVVQRAQEHHLDVLLMLRALSSWGTKLPFDAAHRYEGASLPKDMAHWARFVAAVAERYKGRNVAYEIENEPNAKYWGGSLPEYLQLLKVSYDAIRGADSQARVLSGALACGAAFRVRTPAAIARHDAQLDAWQNGILETRAFNTIGVHDYYYPDKEVNGWTFGSYLKHIRDLAGRKGCGQCAVWITEMGYISRDLVIGRRTDPGSPELQARWTRGALQAAFGDKVERVYWLFLKDHPEAGVFGSMGLFDADGTPRPAAALIPAQR